MENIATTNEASLDSVPQPTYEALEDEEVCNNTSTNQTMETEDDYNMFVEEQKVEDGQYESDHETDMGENIPSDNNGNESNDDPNDEDFSLEYEDDEELCEEKYARESSESCVEPNSTHKKKDPLIVHGNDGMIKKIKICNTTTKNVVGDKEDVKTTKNILNTFHTEGNNILQPRSSTPMSREYLALQRSVNESKILTEFVIDAASEKPRKLRGKESSNSQIPSTVADHSYSSSVKKSMQVTPEKCNPDDIYNSISPSQGKRQYNKRYAPLKDSDSDVDSSSNLRPRSRSKSMHNSEFAGSHKKLKKWPSEERLQKRTNMRSENTEFAQKQMEFLQRVIHACDNPRSRSRSRSCGRRTPNSLNESSLGGAGGGGSGGSGPPTQHQKSHKSICKERNAKRNKYDISSENDEHLLGETTIDQHDDEWVNESQASSTGINLTADNGLTDNNEVEAHLKTVWQPSPKHGYDSFCWKCHNNKVNLCCCKCIRSFHAACVKINKFDNIWMCPECTAVENVLNNPKRLRRNELSLDLLSQLLSFALKRMRYTKGHYSFVMPYEESTVYKKYIVNPVTLTGLEAKIEAKEFRCAEEFVNETKWMLHNAYILSSRNTKIVLAAKSIFKICRQEANEIETCAECYLNANTRTDWFVDVCSHPHLLLWAKLKGFPYWPAKAMGPGQNSLINVRFFGEHDRAFVPLKDCFLYSVQDPNTATGKRAARELADCIKEVEEHIEKIKSKVGGFKYAPFKTPYEPAEEMKQLSEMMPGVDDFIKKQQGTIIKPSLQFKIYKTADNNLSIVQKASTTPELLLSTTHDMNEEENKEKRKKLCSESNDIKKIEDLITSPAKYEVVSKVSSDESNSSKLGTVILKRKSFNSDSKKGNDEAVELPLPKMTKIEEQSAVEEDQNKLHAKRKLENVNMERPKAKHSKLEPKIPTITIKTSVVMGALELHNNDTTNLNDKAATKPDPVSTSPPNDSVQGTRKSQKVVTNLVKVKQGVTIKKVLQNSNSAELLPINSAKEIMTKEILNSKDQKVNKQQKSEDEKARENQKVNSILKGLVPFVEVKKEVPSDHEEGEEVAEKQQKENSPTDKEISLNRNNDNSPASSENPQINKDKTDSQATETATETATENTEKENENEDYLVIAQVKQEILSDEEEANENANLKTLAKQTKTNLLHTSLIGGSKNNISSAEKQPVMTKSTASDIRVVGDTTIQKLPNRNLQQHQQYTVYNNHTQLTNSSNTYAKRVTLKGVPYGPLPASAFPKTLITSKSFLQTDMSLQPRAKKSFPQQSSPPMDKLRPLSNNQNTLTGMSATPSNSHHLDQKRSMAKNTMVTIPVDVTANRTSTSAGTIIIGSIPVPPLTAVSKTIPSSVAHNSTARNSPATITVSCTLGSLTTPSIMIQSKASTTIVSTTATTARNSPITVTSSSPLLAPLTSTSSLSSAVVAATTSSTVISPLSMTTPPPLAGLSNSSSSSSNLIITQQTNGETAMTSSSSSPATQLQNSTETHILGGLVTPTLASAITDVICRGPPKLAVRPNGPLQSEGYPMYPSQAGPVCKRLVENVHKLTDFFISVVEDTMSEMAQGDDASLQAKITLLTMELERNKQAHEQEISELKRTSDLMLCEMRKSMENEKTRLVVEIRKQCEMERLRSVEETKRKQWCANCFREANFYCCWNTSYCDYPCQQLHWARHSLTCAQTRAGINEPTNTATTTSPAERHHHKPNNTITLSSTPNFNKSTSISQKKEKGVTKSSANHMMSSSSITTATSAVSVTRANTEVLKLPTNTYLRPVTTSNLNNQTMRCNTTYSIPVQRFNAPMPLTTPANTSSPQTFTIVQQGNSWVMSSSSTNNSNNSASNNSSSTNSATIAAPIVSVPQVTGQTRTAGTTVGSIITNKSAKTQIRYH